MKKIIFLMCFFAVLTALLVSCEAHEHIYSEELTYDSDYHWHACTVSESCPSKGSREAHDFAVVTDASGKEINQCTVCSATNDMVNKAPEHEHVFDTAFTYSDNFHWYPCTVEGCYAMHAKAEHAFGNPTITYTESTVVITSVCVDCQKESITEKTVSTKVETATDWDKAFENFKPTNYTLEILMTRGDESRKNFCILTETDAYCRIEDDEEFYTVLVGGAYKTYLRTEDTVPFTRLLDNTDSFFTKAKNQTALFISLAENFEKFTYNAQEGCYVCEEPITATQFDASGAQQGNFFCYNTVVTITDGAISTIEAQYYFESKDEGDFSFRYSNIGSSAVKIPKSVIQDAISEGGASDDKQESGDTSHVTDKESGASNPQYGTTTKPGEGDIHYGQIGGSGNGSSDKPQYSVQVNPDGTTTIIPGDVAVILPGGGEVHYGQHGGGASSGAEGDFEFGVIVDGNNTQKLPEGDSDKASAPEKEGTSSSAATKVVETTKDK